MNDVWLNSTGVRATASVRHPLPTPTPPPPPPLPHPAPGSWFCFVNSVLFCCCCCCCCCYCVGVVGGDGGGGLFVCWGFVIVVVVVVVVVIVVVICLPDPARLPEVHHTHSRTHFRWPVDSEHCHHRDPGQGFVSNGHSRTAC